MTKILLCGDLHLRDQPAINNAPEALADQWNSLEFIATASHQYDAVCFAGDLFDFKQPSKSSHALVLRAIDTFRRMHNAYAVAGNHDLSADRIESLHVKQPLGVVLSSGALSLLHGWHPELPIFGLSWLQQWEDRSARMLALQDFREYRDPNSLLVTHCPLFPPGAEPPYEYVPLEDMAEAMGGRGFCFYGHIHDDHGVYEHGGVTFANHGSINRARLVKSDIERTIAVTEWDSTTGAFTAINIPGQAPASRIFKLDSANAARAESRSLDEFLAAVGRSSLDISSKIGITEHLRSRTDVPEPVITKAIDLIEEQDG